METPLVILAFTNEAPTDTKYLRSLSLERGKLEDVLEVAAEKKLCQYKVYSERPLDKILVDLGKEAIRKKLVVFHYAGHADSLSVRFKDKTHQTVSVELTKLASVFKDCPQLQLIFLNGCSSINQAETFLKAGIPIVIGTDRNIADDIATDFAELFYKQLQENTIANAFKYAVAHFRALYDAQPDKYYRAEVRGQGLHPAGHIPFTIQYRQDIQELGRWSLLEAANQPLFGLPEIPDESKYNWPVVPYNYLQAYDTSSARIFRGRGREISQLYRAITNPLISSDAIITISGQSGVGKSSLLQAGLLPRLRTAASVIYLRWDANQDFKSQISSSLGGKEDQIRETWVEKERQEDQPQIIILDQIDEIFNAISPGGKNDEWSALVRLLVQIFSDPEKAPKGRLGLSYRTEIHQKITEDLHLVGLNSDDHFIRRLDRLGIIEVVHGLDRQQGEDIAKVYRLSVEPGLGDDIASFLLRDPQSPVAPILQIILTRLWKNCKKENDRHFTRSGFIELTQQGVWLKDFYSQQIENLKRLEATYALPVESSGLALDFLNYHTTDRATAQNHSLEKILYVYRHQEPSLIHQLLADLDQLSLIAVKDHASILAHDTLGPIIKETFEQSTRPGQNAKRILKSKLIEYKLRPDEAILEEPALDIILAGKVGMQHWNKEEEFLIEKSLKRLEAQRLQEAKEERKRKLRWALGIVGLALITTLVFGLNALLNKQSHLAAFTAAKQQASDDPTNALKVMREIYNEHELDTKYQNDLYEVYRNNLIYDEKYSYPGYLSKTAFSPNGQNFAVTTGENNNVYLFQFDEANVIDSFTMTSSQIENLIFDNKGCLFIASADRRAYRWCPSGNAQPVIYAPVEGVDSSFVKAIIPARYLDRCYSLQAQGQVYVWSKEKGEWLGEINLPNDAKAIAPLINPVTDQEGVWIGTQSGQVYGFSDRESSQYELNRNDRGAVTALQSSMDGKHLLVGTSYGDLEYWKYEADSWRLITTFASENGEVLRILIDPDAQWFAVTYSLGQTSVGTLTVGGVLRKLDGQKSAIHSLGYSHTEQKLLSADTAGTIRSWNVLTPNAFRTDTLSYSIMAAAFDMDDRFIAIDKSMHAIQIALPNEPTVVIENAKDQLSILPAVSNEADQILAQSNTGQLKVIDVLGKNMEIIDREFKSIEQLAISKSHFAVMEDSVLHMIPIGGGQAWQKKLGPVVALKFNQEENLVIAAKADGEIYWYEVSSGNSISSRSFNLELKSILPTTSDQVYLLSHDGTLLRVQPKGDPEHLTGGRLFARALENGMYVTVTADKISSFSSSGYKLEEFRLPANTTVSCLAISYQGQWIAVGTKNGKIHYWRTSKQPLALYSD